MPQHAALIQLLIDRSIANLVVQKLSICGRPAMQRSVRRICGRPAMQRSVRSQACTCVARFRPSRLKWRKSCDGKDWHVAAMAKLRIPT